MTVEKLQEGVTTAKKNVLIVGSGYLGEALDWDLTDHEYSVTLADLHPHQENCLPVDVRDGSSVAALAQQVEVPDVVVLSVSTAGGDEGAYKQLYLDGTKHVLQHFPQSQLCLCSSTSVYGVDDGSWVTEAHSVNPFTPKGEILHEAEKLVMKAGGLVARLSAMYGPERCELLTRFLSKGQALRGDRHRWLNYIHRDDVALGIRTLIERGEAGSCYNVTDQTPMQMDEIYAYLCAICELEMPTFEEIRATDRRGHSNKRVSCERLLSLGWEPLFPGFQDGVHHLLCEWDNQHPGFFNITA